MATNCKWGGAMAFSVVGGVLASCQGSAQQPTCWEPSRQVCVAPGCFDVGFAWSGQPVDFALLQDGSSQIVAYYDAERRMVVARNDGKGFKDRIILPTQVGWDSHNGIAMAKDSSGKLHLSGNMHADKMNYFVSSGRNMIQSLRAVYIGKSEIFSKVTYPKFFKDKNENLFYLFRTGVAGNGAYNLLAYDTGIRRWHSLADGPFMDFRGKGSPYIDGPHQDRSGLYHIAWTIRLDRNVENNRDIFYARSSDLIHWVNSKGVAIPTPIGVDMGEKVVDSPVGSGIINGNIRMAFDRQDRPVIIFSKYTTNATLGIFVSRLEDSRWRTALAKDLGIHAKITGGGSLDKLVWVLTPRMESDGEFHARYIAERKSYNCIVSDNKLTLEACSHESQSLTRGLMQTSRDRPGMNVKVAQVFVGATPRYLLRWETLTYNRDKPRNIAPPPSRLQLFDLRYANICHPNGN